MQFGGSLNTVLNKTFPDIIVEGTSMVLLSLDARLFEIPRIRNAVGGKATWALARYRKSQTVYAVVCIQDGIQTYSAGQLEGKDV